MDANYEAPITNAPAGAAGPAEDKKSSKQRCACAIALSFDEQSNLVYAHLTPSDEARPVTVYTLRAQLEAAGYGAYHAPDATLEAIVRSANNAEPGNFVVAERRDATTEWRISDDKQTVYVTVHAACGGQPVTRQLIMDELSHLSVPKRCVENDALESLLSGGEASNVLIAKAIPPIHGKDSQFEVLIDIEQDPFLVEDEQGRVDMRQTHTFLAVEPNTPLMRRIAATAGAPGTNVVGEPLPPKAGRDLPFAKECPGTQPDPKDTNTLLSSIKGHPVSIPQGIRVDPVLRVKNVDLSTGNIDFDGSVEVAGDVTSGFSVKATGDILIRGMVEQAYVSAGKDLTILGGVVGEQQKDNGQAPTKLGAHLKSGQNLTAKFINLADVTAGVDLTVREYALHCNLRAGRDLLFGQPTGKGNLIGGRAKAGRSLVVNILGCAANIAGTVQVGTVPRRKRLLSALHQELELCESNQKKLAALLAAADQSSKVKLSEQRRDQAKRTQLLLVRRRHRLQSLIERMTPQQQTGSEPHVHIKRQLYANVSINIDGVRHLFGQDQGPCQLIRSGAELVKT